MKNIEEKRLKEKLVVEEMIHIYCKKHHKKANQEKKRLCPDCQALCDYAHKRSDLCPFMEQKNFCSNCKVHCYSPDMRSRIREVMRFSGPRMLLYHPILTTWHLISSFKEKRSKKK